MKKGILDNDVTPHRKKTPFWVPLLMTLAFYTGLFLFLVLEPFSHITEESVNYITLNTDVMQIEQEPGGGPSFTAVSRKEKSDAIKGTTDSRASTADAGVNMNDSTLTKQNTEGAATPDSVNSSRITGDTLNYLDFYSGSGGGGTGTSGFLSTNSKLPTFLGGDFNSFRQWFSKKLRVPVDRPKEIVNVTFIVDKNGMVSNVKVKSCSSPEVRDEILKVMRKAPRWEPGVYNDKPAGFTFQMNVNFK